MVPEDRVGSIYGIYKIIGIERKKKNDNRIYMCECIYCGRKSILSFSNINRAVKCTHLNKNGKYKDYNYLWKNKRIGNIFRGMIDRCYNENDKAYRWYGEKGIKIYEQWINNPLSFEEWAINNGYDDSLTIDRIDENKDYCPENCRWISRKNNAKYKSTTRLIIVDGESHTGREWGSILGLSISLINEYVRLYGMDDTVEFIRRFLKNPSLRERAKCNERVFDIYMS